jgi:Zn-dependent protease
MSPTVSSPPICARCGNALGPTDLTCSACGQLVHLEELTQLSAQAQWLEPQNPTAAAAVWRQCLELVPPESPQADLLRDRIDSLHAPPAPSAGVSWQYAVLRTGISMLVSIAVYGIFFGWTFAAGFVLLILIHEMGHVIALRHYGIRASPPTFIPFIGAIITVMPMRDALQEAIVGIGGPVLGTVGAIGCFAIYCLHHNQILLDLSFYGVFINLINLLPIPPLDGGRVMAAVSPWAWIVGLVALVGLLAWQYVQAGDSFTGVSPVMALILIIAAPRLWRTFRYRERTASYYNTAARTSRAIGAAYLLLAGVLIGMYFWTEHLGAGQ